MAPSVRRLRGQTMVDYILILAVVPVLAGCPSKTPLGAEHADYAGVWHGGGSHDSDAPRLESRTQARPRRRSPVSRRAGRAGVRGGDSATAGPRIGGVLSPAEQKLFMRRVQEAQIVVQRKLRETWIELPFALRPAGEDGSVDLEFGENQKEVML